MDRPPRWFTVVAVIALLWNLLGCLAFASDLLLTPADVSKLSEAQQALYKARTAWAVASTALAVIAGALGCVGLLLGKTWAFPAFLASLAGIVVQDYGLFVVVDGAKLAGPVAVVMQGLVFLIAVGLIVLSRQGIARGWLR
jgi:hypothetical protein